VFRSDACRPICSKYIALHKVNFSLDMGFSFLVLHDFQILYTGAQIFQLGGHDVL